MMKLIAVSSDVNSTVSVWTDTRKRRGMCNTMDN